MSSSSANKESSFWERFLMYVNVTDPRTLIYSEAKILDAKRLLDTNAPMTEEERSFNKNLVSAAIHPATGEVIPKIFRVSAIAPVNIPLVFAMLTCPASNIPGTLFLHWLNQSYNTACNYANRSGSDQSMEQLMKAYGLAVTSACTLAYGLGKAVAKGPKSLQRFGPLIPCLATAAANCSNIAFTRMDEMTSGVNVFDEDGKTYGTSCIAGQTGVMQSALTRCVLVPCACLLIPPIFMTGLGRLNLLPASARMKMMVEIGIIFASLQGALPAALAVFPQTIKFKVEDLESKFSDARDENGNKIQYLYGNKGL